MPTAYSTSSTRSGFLLIEVMVAAAVTGVAVASLVTVMGRALVVSQVVAEQASASEAAGRMVAQAILTDSLLQSGLTPAGSDPIGRLGRSGMPLDGRGELRERWKTSTLVEAVDGLSWLRVAVEWTGPGGRKERLERATVVGLSR